MAATKLRNAVEESTYVITASFKDENGNSLVPKSILWTLTNSDGTIINLRESVSILVPASSVDIVLSGNDLAIGSNGIKRIITISAAYDSSYGNNLPLNASATFKITDLAAV